MIRLDRIIVTQNSLRDIELSKRIANDIEKGIWFEDPVRLVRTEDEILYLWDGLHRAFGCFLASVYELPLDKYSIKSMTYRQLASINFELRYVTPFDPKYYCRKADFFPFKEKVMGLYDNLGYRNSLKYIIRHELDYLELRRISLVEDVEY